MQALQQPATTGSTINQDPGKTPTGSHLPAGTSQAGGQPEGPAARFLAYARTHRKTLAAAAAAALAAGYAATHAVHVLRARRRVGQALEAYAQAEAELEAVEARGWLGFGRKKTPLERAEENF